MTTIKNDKGKHLTNDNRNFIEDALYDNYTLKLIAEQLDKDPTTISKKIRKNRIASLHKKDNMKVSCSNRKECNQKYLCGASCNRLCKICTTINCYKKYLRYIVKSVFISHVFHMSVTAIDKRQTVTTRNITIARRLHRLITRTF